MPATPTATTTAVRPMGTGTSRRGFLIAALAAAAVGCGASQTSAFGWLHAHAPPSNWKVAGIPSGAAMAYPPTWRRAHGDPGTATVVLLSPNRHFLGYLNLTPRQGAETLANWSTFRVRHNAEEGDRGIKRLAAAQGLHFLTGHGSCVKDSYATEIGAQYVEIACLVAGARTTSVIVGAAPPAAWSRVSGTLERAIAGVTT